jgi:hypothetical protein
MADGEPTRTSRRTIDLSADRTAIVETEDGRIRLTVVGERMASTVTLDRDEGRAVALAVIEASQQILEEEA